MQNLSHTTYTGTSDNGYRRLYQVGAAAALIAALIFRRNLDAEIMLLKSTRAITFGPAALPVTVAEWFSLLQDNKLLGLTLLNLFDMVNYALVGLIFLALYFALKRERKAGMALAVILGFTGITIYLASNQALSLLSLSDQYAHANDPALKAMLLAAGQAVLAIHQNASYQGTGIYPSFLLVSVAGLIISAVMLRSKLFSPVSGFIGFLANGFCLGYYLFLAWAPGFVFLPLSISALFLLAWYLLIARRLWVMGSLRTGPTIDYKLPGKLNVVIKNHVLHGAFQPTLTLPSERGQEFRSDKGLAMKKATRLLISTFGALVGLIGIEHGLGEVLQGNQVPTGRLILSWPGSDFFQILGGEPAMTILPNLLLTGFLAIIFSLAYLIYAVAFVQRKNSGRILMLLSVAMFLFGGGIFPPVFGLLIGAAATQIHAPLTWWRSHLSPGLRRVLGKLWPWFFGACILSWLSMFPGLTCLNYYFGVEDTNLILMLLVGMFGFLPLTGIAGLARDLQGQSA